MRTARVPPSQYKGFGHVANPAKAWDGQLPAGSEMPRCDDLFDAGFLPVECEAGDLLVFAGELDHLSCPTSARHEPSAGIAWSPDNWLQYPGGAAFPPLGGADAASVSAAQ